MNSKLASKLRSSFRVRMAERLPMFSEIKTPGGAWVQPGDRIYEWSVGQALSCFILLILYPRADAFRLDVGWSSKKRLPPPEYFVPRDWPERGIEKDEPVDGEFHFGLAFLWQYKNDQPWYITEDSLTDAVSDAVGKVETYAIPYLRGVIAEISKAEPAS